MTTEVTGPIDFLLLEFDADKATGEAAAALFELIEQGIIRLYDFSIIRKQADGTVVGVELEDVTADSIGGFSTFVGARSGMLGDDDVAEAGGAMEPGTTAALFVYENSWAVPFITAARKADAQVIASARIPSDVVMSVLDELDAADAAG
jgi:uncharacterized membrane protein